MFTELAELLTQPKDLLTFTVAREGTDLRVTVTPRLGEKGALNQPLVLTGTPAELDSPDLPAALRDFTASRQDLRTALAEATAATKAEADKARKGKGKPAPAAAKKEEPKAEAKKPASANPNNPLLKRVTTTPKAEPAQPTAPRNAEEATQSLL